MRLRPDSDQHATRSIVPRPSPAGAEVDIRPLRTADEYAACVGLQRETWGGDYDDIVPASVLKIVQRVGGVALGAFHDDGALEGFVFGITGVERGELVHWSHMLAVRPGMRGGGIGRRLKEAQRDLLRTLGVDRIYWTFDPLVARNAHLNLTRLGVEVMEYVPDMYGESESPLHRGVGTDRFVVAWHIGSAARDSLAREVTTATAVHAPVANPDNGSGTDDGAIAPSPTEAVVRVAVPSDIEQVQAASLAAAAGWRRSTRRALQHYLGRGYQVAGFYGDERSARGYYVLAAADAHAPHAPRKGVQ